MKKPTFITSETTVEVATSEMQAKRQELIGHMMKVKEVGRRIIYPLDDLRNRREYWAMEVTEDRKRLKIRGSTEREIHVSAKKQQQK